MKQQEKRGKLYLGVLFIKFSGAIKRGLKVRDIAMPKMLKLSRLVKESVILAVCDSKDAILTETIHPAMDTFSTLKVLPDEGARTSSYCTSIGKAMLADMTDREQRRFFEDKHRQRFTSNTITNFKDMRKHISIVRRECVAFDNEGYSLGVRSVSAGFRNSDGRTDGAIGILGPMVRLSRSRAR